MLGSRPVLSSSGPVTPSFAFDEEIAACDLCGGRDFAILSSAANVRACVRCGYRFVSPRPSQAQIAASYSDPSFYSGWIDDDAGRQRMWSRRLDLLHRVGAGARVIDIGAGIGTFLAMGRDRYGWQVTGTEISSSAVQLARDRHGVDLMLGDAESLELPEHAFDLVTLWHVLEHVPSPARTLSLCRRLLRKEGLLAIAVPNSDDARGWLIRTKANLRGKPVPERYEPLRPHSEVHLSNFTSRVLVNALRQRGFRVERVTLDNQYANPTIRTDTLVRSYRLIRNLTGLNFGQATFVLARSIIDEQSPVRVANAS